MISGPILLGEEVAGALREGRPVVALETAVVTHGLPAPQNLEALALMSRRIVEKGAVPAVCLVAGGHLHVGASEDTVEMAANDVDREKASARDIGSALIRGVSAGLTVSGTLAASVAIGIRAFATGGIGGVHSDHSSSGDVSADLPQLSRSRVVTVCSGAKSVLDIPRTLEYLETQGVPVYAYRTDQFPAFYLRTSGRTTDCLDSPQAIAEACTVQWRLGYEGGMVIGNPLTERDALCADDWEEWVARAHSDAARLSIRGKDVTPFLLARVAEFSNGRTVTANLALLEANASLAAEIAVALSTK